MRAHFGVCHGIIRHSFRADTHWRGGSKEEILPRHVIHRHRDFAVIECVKTDGMQCIVESVQLNSGLHEHFRVFTAVYLENRRMSSDGCCQVQSDNQNLPDPFLMHDQTNILPGCTDPSYRPLPETFEPWAQDYARSESVTGFGLIQEDTALWEPWCWRFINAQSDGIETTYEHQEQSGNDDTSSTTFRRSHFIYAPTASSLENFSTSPPTCRFDPDATLLSHFVM